MKSVNKLLCVGAAIASMAFSGCYTRRVIYTAPAVVPTATVVPAATIVPTTTVITSPGYVLPRPIFYHRHHWGRYRW